MRGDTEKLDAAALGSGRETCKTFEHDRNAPRDHIIERRRGARRVDKGKVHLGAVTKQFPGQMRLAATIGRTE